MLRSARPGRSRSSDRRELDSWSNLASRLVLVVVAGVVAITLTVIIATLNRGFDWTDEGFVYAMITSNRVSTGDFWGFQHLLNPFYELLGNSILSFRILRLLGYLSLSVVLTLVARALLQVIDVKLSRLSWILVLLVGQIGTFVAWSYPPRYLGYNELSSWLAQVGGALLILLLVSGRTSSNRRIVRLRWLLWALVGVTVAMLVLAKVTAAVVLGGLALMVVFVPSYLDSWVKRLGALVGGSVATLAVLLTLGVPVFAYARAIINLVFDPLARSASGYSLGTLLNTYLTSSALTVHSLAIPFILAAFALFASRGFTRRTKELELSPATQPIGLIALASTGFLTLWILLPNSVGTWGDLGIANAFTFALALIAFCFLYRPAAPAVDGVPAGSPAVTASLSIVLFAIAPFASAVGTNNPIFGQTAFSATLWAIGAGVTLCALWERSEATTAAVRLIPLVVLSVIVASSGLAVAGDVFLHPYRTIPYFKQHVDVGVGDLRGIQVTEGEAELFRWLHAVGAREKAQDIPTLSLGTPGALLAFNASGWSNAWPGPDWADSIGRACGNAYPDELYILQNLSEKPGTLSFDMLVAGLDKCAIDFPADFSVVSTHNAEDPALSVTVWKMN